MPDGLLNLWLHPSMNVREEHYWPLTYSTIWIEHQLFGMNFAAFRIINILLHALNSVLVFLILRRLAVPGAWLAGALFALHPVHAESAAWVIERKDVLSAFFYLLSFITFTRYEENGKRSSYILSIALYAAGMLSKSIVVSLPATLLVYMWWQRGKLQKADVLRTVPFFAVGLVLTALDLTILHMPGHYYQALMNPLERVGIASRALLFYLRQLFFPVWLMAIHPQWSPQSAWNYAAFAAVAALVAAGWILRTRLPRGVIAAVLIYILTLSPILGFIDFGWMVYSFVADRFQYLASASLLALLAAALWRFVPAKHARYAVAAVLLLACGSLTAYHSRRYSNAEFLWSHNIRLNPAAFEAHHHYGIWLSDQKRYADAIKAYQKSIQTNPHYAPAHQNLGVAQLYLGKVQEAQQSFETALKLQPEFPDALNSMGSVLAEQGKLEEAIAYFQRALQLDPFSSDAAENLKMAQSELANKRGVSE